VVVELDLPDALADDLAAVVGVPVGVTEVAPSVAVTFVAEDVSPWDATRVPVMPAKAATLAAAVTRRARAAAWRRVGRTGRGATGPEPCGGVPGGTAKGSGAVDMRAVWGAKVKGG